MRCSHVLVVAALAAVAHGGCGSSELWSPVGTYELVQVWQGGNCGLTTPRTITMAVIASDEAASGFLVTLTEPGLELAEVAIRPFDERCDWSFTISEPSGGSLPFGGQAFSLVNLVEQDMDVEGSGSLNVGAPDNCSQNFTIEGMKSP